MSFGYSVGDFIAVGQLAWQVYKSCKDAPEGFRNVSQEVLSLHAVLKEAEETLSGHPLSRSQESSLATITGGCQDVLKDLQTLVLRYESLGSKTKRTWDRLRWHSNDIAELRARLTSNTVLLTAYMSTSQFVVEIQLNKFMQEFRDGKHEQSVVTTQTIESLSTDEKEKWRNIRKELENIGISVAAFDANKVFILEWFKEASITGAFEEQTLEDDSRSISYSNHSRQSSESLNSTSSAYFTQQVPSPRSKDAESLDSDQRGMKIITTEILHNSVLFDPQINIQGRSQSTMGESSLAPDGLPREGSEILNQVVFNKLEADIERERGQREQREHERKDKATIPLKAVSSEGINDEGRGGSRSKHDNTATSSNRENTKFGDYFLGNTLGEESSGKVKMGWKQEGGVQVAIKLIRRAAGDTETSEIAREIAILREISHPNIIRLLEKVETEKHIGIVVEYLSGEVLFDYIAHYRRLKDSTSKKLFVQLLSGVGYLHQKGIVHRALCLENIWLDQNSNIIMSNFEFANTFNPNNNSREEINYNLASRKYNKRVGLDEVLLSKSRRGDLMQTHCGVPSYAAPEVLIPGSLYAGCKADVWSCGVILYAMLAGYLPFDDDLANPEGKDIKLLYKYILSTPLTFPEHVTLHARDLLGRILVPDPKERAGLFEVTRHSWLSQYAHLVGFITSRTTTTEYIANATASMDDHAEVPLVAHSTSVRDTTRHVPRYNGSGP